MSSDKRFVLSRVPRGTGLALDLGGGRGQLREALESRGYSYVNIDTFEPGGGRAVRGDASRLPFTDSSVTLVVSSDSLEHFADPQRALNEVTRVLSDDGRLVVWVPFLHPFHGNDYYRFTPIALRMLYENAGLRIESLEAPLRMFSIVAQMAVALLASVGLGRLEPLVEAAGERLDRALRRLHGQGLAYAAFYLVVGRPQNARS